MSPIRWRTSCDGLLPPLSHPAGVCQAARLCAAPPCPPPPTALYRRVSGTYRRPDSAQHLQGKGYEAIRYDPALDTQLR